MNAIERLREFTECPNIDIDAALHSGCVYCDAREERGVGPALAAVDALYQAAKALNENRTRPINREWNALAAAVRRIEGTP